MAKNDDTEEKSLPPSQVKLNRLRREGQVARSKELPAAFSVLVITLFIVWTYPSILSSFASFFDPALQLLPVLGGPSRDGNANGGDMLAVTLASAEQMLLLVAAPAVLGLAAALMAAIIDGQGLIVSMKHMSPDFAKLNPVEGLKKMFSLSSLVEFIKSLVKCAILLVAGGGTILYFVNGLFWSPLCGVGCTLAVSGHMISTMVIIASLIMLTAAFFDIRISRALFRHEHRMTKTEAKRENKDMYGDPAVRSARRQIGAEIRNAPPAKVKPDSKSDGPDT